MDAYTGQDVIEIEDQDGKFTLSDFADGVVAELVAPNDAASLTTGYNGNCLGAHNESGRQRQCTLRVVKASNDDKRINKIYTLWQNRDRRFKPLKGWFTKNVTHADGSVTQDTVTCFFGLPQGKPTQQTDTAGGTDQVVSVYTVMFGNSERSL